MPISGIAVMAAEGQAESVKQAIEAQPGMDVVSQVGDYLVVVLEAPSPAACKAGFERILALPGVASAEVAYYDEQDVRQG